MISFKIYNLSIGKISDRHEIVKRIFRRGKCTLHITRDFFLKVISTLTNNQISYFVNENLNSII